MIEQANKNLKNNKNQLNGSVSFSMSLSQLNKLNEKFDLIFTERVLINLNSWDEQMKTLIKISELLNVNGVYCMCESSINALVI